MHLMTRSRIVAIMLGVALGIHHTSAGAANPNEFVDVSVPDLPGQLYIPPEAQDSPRPVILFLHGAGETGTNNTSQINGNIDNLFAAAKDQGAFLYAPQATTVSGQIFNWSDIPRTTNVITKLDDILSSMNTDTDRVYITGLSMGGGGTWNMASRSPGKFAAALSIAGVRVADDFDAANLVGIPTWAFHARDDTTVSKDESRNVVNSILAAAGEPPLDIPRRDPNHFEFVNDDLGLRYTEFTSGGHQIWGPVYGTTEVIDWMFSQSQAVPEPGTFILLICGTGLAWSATCRRKDR